MSRSIRFPVTISNASNLHKTAIAESVTFTTDDMPNDKFALPSQPLDEESLMIIGKTLSQSRNLKSLTVERSDASNILIQVFHPRFVTAWENLTTLTVQSIVISRMMAARLSRILNSRRSVFLKLMPCEIDTASLVILARPLSIRKKPFVVQILPIPLEFFVLFSRYLRISSERKDLPEGRNIFIEGIIDLDNPQYWSLLLRSLEDVSIDAFFIRPLNDVIDIEGHCDFIETIKNSSAAHVFVSAQMQLEIQIN